MKNEMKAKPKETKAHATGWSLKTENKGISKIRKRTPPGIPVIPVLYRWRHYRVRNFKPRIFRFSAHVLL